MQKISPHKLPPEFHLDKEMETKIGMYYFYGNIVVVEAKEGITLSYKTEFSILLKALTILESDPWVYIANRVHSYSIKPLDYNYLNEIPSLMGIAIVNYNPAARSNAVLESKFCTKQFAVFHNLVNAVQWAKGLL
ncbi:MAG: hypothetical protein JJE55_09095 [Flavobacteriaceae bacterium]|nr:hypothetical protein [Flavobacteriaceae bacterium]